MVETHPEQTKKDKQRLKSFEELECWKACTEVRRFITQLVKTYIFRVKRTDLVQAINEAFIEPG